MTEEFDKMWDKVVEKYSEMSFGADETVHERTGRDYYEEKLPTLEQLLDMLSDEEYVKWLEGITAALNLARKRYSVSGMKEFAIACIMFIRYGLEWKNGEWV